MPLTSVQHHHERVGDVMGGQQPVGLWAMVLWAVDQGEQRDGARHDDVGAGRPVEQLLRRSTHV